jgi:homoserine dehydrogenase
MNARVVGLVVAAVVLSACRARQVDVRTAPPQQQQVQVAVQVNNNLTQAVNVYVNLNGTDTFLRQVGGSSSATIPVQGFAAGSSVTLKAVTVDGVRTYQRQNVVLTGTVTFPLP